jgi:uncharacterized membrane protein YkoI
MKRHTFRVFNTSVFSKLRAIAVIILISAASVKAQDYASNTLSPKNANVKYLMTQNDNMFFQVQLDNEDGDKFSVAVKDQEGAVLFQEIYNDKKFDKKFRLPKTDDGKVVFVIKNLKDNTAQTFDINAFTRTIQEVVVVKRNG